MARRSLPCFRRLLVTAAGAALALIALGVGPATSRPVAAADPACQLGRGGAIQHVIYVQFDNTHLLRDRATVPSDLEQMPHLLNFMRDNGTLLGNDHTVLISHTAGGILSSLTGVYPDRHGQIVSNSNVRFNGAGFQFPSSFGYWTDPVVAAAPTVPNMVTPDGKNAPAPWVPYTRAGCDFGAVATANTVLENTGTGPSGDITKVFGNPSPQWTEAENARLLPNTPANAKAKAMPQADFVGFAIHCAQGSTTCAGGQADALPDEPNGYADFKGMFGAQEIDPLLTGGPASQPVTDLLGADITDQYGNPGFPGFDGLSAAVSLAYTAEMQEAGVPVTFSYISDAHDNHGVAGNIHLAYGPGSAGYVAQLKAYDAAFAAFFDRLATDGINKSNTLFVFTVDEGDHFVGGTPTPADCDGVNVACDWTGQVGEINANIQTLMHEQHPEITSVFTVHGDDAPTFYLSGNPDPATTPVRNFERAAATLTAVNPYTNATDPLMVRMANRAEMRLLHMFTTGDPLRNPTFAYFADPNYFLTDFPPTTCKTCINPAFAWNHGDFQPDIATTWLGFVGPGIRNLGQDDDLWADHTDVRPTMLTLLGLRDDYSHDGRALIEFLHPSAVPSQLAAHRATLLRLGEAYKQLDAPFGALSLASLDVATEAITSGSAAGDAHYAAVTLSLTDWANRRDTLTAEITALLEGAEFGGQAINEGRARTLTRQAWSLIAEVQAAAP